MNTYNLGLVFGQTEIVIIIVCASEDPIDIQAVNYVATKYFKSACHIHKDIPSVIREVIKGLKAECGCEAVSVTADATCMFHHV